ncbi:hypothetical protein, partial [Limnohabitans sp.]|uniref:hypothetical protein n=1 Tax=Limnohabitans sp. TaxID=1907725 RepID=UPI0033405884
RAIVLKMDGATLALFELYYSSPKFLLADLLSDDQCVRASAAQALCDTPVCCLDAGFSPKVKLLCPSPAALLEPKPLQTLVRACFLMTAPTPPFLWSGRTGRTASFSVASSMWMCANDSLSACCLRTAGNTNKQVDGP